jgi:hypothetical protein
MTDGTCPMKKTTAMTDCTQYLATSAKAGDLITRDGRVVVASKTDWERVQTLVGSLIPAPRRPFGAVDLIDDGHASEVTVDELRAVVLAAIPGTAKVSVDAAASAIHQRLYGPALVDQVAVSEEP